MSSDVLITLFGLVITAGVLFIAIANLLWRIRSEISSLEQRLSDKFDGLGQRVAYIEGALSAPYRSDGEGEKLSLFHRSPVAESPQSQT